MQSLNLLKDKETFTIEKKVLDDKKRKASKSERYTYCAYLCQEKLGMLYYK